MANTTIDKKDERKAWISPELQRIDAGSAEGGQGTVPDGGGPGASRS